MAARAKVIEADTQPSDGHPCFVGFAGSYAYGGRQYEVRLTSERAEFDTCAAMAVRALGDETACGAPVVSAVLCTLWQS